MMEMDYVLALWLKEPPQYSAVFCRMILATFLIDRLSIGYMVAVQAYGKIAGYQATLGSCLILTLPLVWLFFQFGAPPSHLVLRLLLRCLCLGRARLWVRKLFCVHVDSGYRAFFYNVSCGSASALTARFVLVLPPSFVRCCLVLFASFSTLGRLGAGPWQWRTRVFEADNQKIRLNAKITGFAAVF